MHYAKIEKSDRLKRVYARLLQGPATTLQIIQDSGVCAVNSAIAELRENGIGIECKALRRGVFEYRLQRLF